MAEYEKEFSHLSKYAPELVLTEAFWCRQFEDGLHDSIKRYLAPRTSLQTVDFYQLVQAAMKVERLETSNKERFQKKKFSRGASSSSGKELENLQLNQNIVPLREVEGRGPMYHIVPVEVLQLDKEKFLNALIAIKGFWEFEDSDRRVFSVWKP